MSIERRKHQRIVSEIFVRFHEDSEEHQTPLYSEGAIHNCTNGGIFITTPHPLPVGSMIFAELHVHSHAQGEIIVHVRGVVRWVRHISEQQGMGIEIFEYAGPSEGEFINCILDMLLN